MTSARLLLLRLRRQRGLHLAAIADGGAAGTRAEWHKQQAAKLALQIAELEEEVKREEAGNDG